MEREPIGLIPDEFLTSSGFLGVSFSESLFLLEDLGIKGLNLTQLNEFKERILSVSLKVVVAQFSDDDTTKDLPSIKAWNIT